MPVDLQRRRTHSRRRSLEFAGVSILACMSAGLLLGAAVGAATWAYFELAAPVEERLSWRAVVAFALVGGGICVAAWVPLLVDAAIRGKKAVLRRARAQAPDARTARRLDNVLEEVSTAAGIPCPAAAVIDDDFPNAMTAGHGPKDATVVVTTGLLTVMNRQELQAVVAHEVAHIKDGDLRFMTFLAVSTARFRTAMSFLLEAYTWSIVGIVVWPPVALTHRCLLLARRAMSRERELLADDTAVLLTRDPAALVSALTKIGWSVVPPHKWKADIAPLFIVDPNHVWTGEDSVPLLERVERLRSLMPSPEDEIGRDGASEDGGGRSEAPAAGPTSPPSPALP
jgi:heat shock protein HtpX